MYDQYFLPGRTGDPFEAENLKREEELRKRAKAKEALIRASQPTPEPAPLQHFSEDSPIRWDASRDTSADADPNMEKYEAPITPFQKRVMDGLDYFEKFKEHARPDEDPSHTAKRLIQDERFMWDQPTKLDYLFEGAGAVVDKLGLISAGEHLSNIYANIKDAAIAEEFSTGHDPQRKAIRREAEEAEERRQERLRPRVLPGGYSPEFFGASQKSLDANSVVSPSKYDNLTIAQKARLGDLFRKYTQQATASIETRALKKLYSEMLPGMLSEDITPEFFEEVMKKNPEGLVAYAAAGAVSDTDLLQGLVDMTKAVISEKAARDEIIETLLADGPTMLASAVAGQAVGGAAASMRALYRAHQLSRTVPSLGKKIDRAKEISRLAKTLRAESAAEAKIADKITYQGSRLSRIGKETAKETVRGAALVTPGILAEQAATGVQFPEISDVAAASAEMNLPSIGIAGGLFGLRAAFKKALHSGTLTPAEAKHFIKRLELGEVKPENLSELLAQKEADAANKAKAASFGKDSPKALGEPLMEVVEGAMDETVPSETKLRFSEKPELRILSEEELKSQGYGKDIWESAKESSVTEDGVEKRIFIEEASSDGRTITIAPEEYIQDVRSAVHEEGMHSYLSSLKERAKGDTEADLLNRRLTSWTKAVKTERFSGEELLAKSLSEGLFDHDVHHLRVEGVEVPEFLLEAVREDIAANREHLPSQVSEPSPSLRPPPSEEAHLGRQAKLEEILRSKDEKIRQNKVARQEKLGEWFKENIESADVSETLENWNKQADLALADERVPKIQEQIEGVLERMSRDRDLLRIKEETGKMPIDPKTNKPYRASKPETHQKKLDRLHALLELPRKSEIARLAEEIKKTHPDFVEQVDKVIGNKVKRIAQQKVENFDALLDYAGGGEAPAGVASRFKGAFDWAKKVRKSFKEEPGQVTDWYNVYGPKEATKRGLPLLADIHRRGWDDAGYLLYPEKEVLKRLYGKRSAEATSIYTKQEANIGRMRGAEGTANTMLEHHLVPIFDGGWYGEPKNAIRLEPLPLEVRELLDNYTKAQAADWLYKNENAPTVTADGKILAKAGFSDPVLTEAKIREIFDAVENHPMKKEIQTRAKYIRDFAKRINQYRKDNNIGDAAHWEKVEKNPFYVPLVTDNGFGNSGIYGLETFFSKGKVKTRSVGEPTGRRLIQDASGDTQGRRYAPFEDLPSILVQDARNAVHEATVANTIFQFEHDISLLNDMGVQVLDKEKLIYEVVKGLPEEEAPQTTAPKMPQPGEFEVSLWKDGERKTYRISEEFGILSSLFTPEAKGDFTRLVQGISSLWRSLVTSWSPEFIPKNLLRDIQEGMFLTRRRGDVSQLRVSDIYSGFREALLGDRSQLKYDAGMAGYRMDGVESGMRKVENSALAAQMKYGSIWKQLRNPSVWKNADGSYPPARQVENLWAGFKAIVSKNPGMKFFELASDISEATTRLGNYLAGGRTGSDRALVQARRASMDFKRMGSAIRGYNAVTPFLAIGMQGSETLVRKAIYQPQDFARAYTAMYVTPTIGLALWNVQKPGYKKLSDYEKSNNWILFLNDNLHLSIPKNHEAKALTAPLNVFVDRFLFPLFWDYKGEKISALRGSSASRMSKEVFDNTLLPLGTDLYSYLPPIASISLQMAANYDSFRERPIARDTEIPGMQFRKTTPILLRKLGAAFPNQLSPDMMDFVGRSAGGGLGKIALDMSSDAYRMFFPSEDTDPREIEDVVLGLPILRNFIKKTRDFNHLDWAQSELLRKHSNWKKNQDKKLLSKTKGLTDAERKKLEGAIAQEEKEWQEKYHHINKIRKSTKADGSGAIESNIDTPESLTGKKKKKKPLGGLGKGLSSELKGL